MSQYDSRSHKSGKFFFQVGWEKNYQLLTDSKMLHVFLLLFVIVICLYAVKARWPLNTLRQRLFEAALNKLNLWKPWISGVQPLLNRPESNDENCLSCKRQWVLLSHSVDQAYTLPISGWTTEHHVLIIQEQKALNGLETGDFNQLVVKQPIVEKKNTAECKFWMLYYIWLLECWRV